MKTIKQKLIITKGLPASGKTTWAKEQVENSNGQIKRVSKDDLREMIDNSYHSKGRENSIKHCQEVIIEHYIEEGKSVIVDNTNFGWEGYFKQLALKLDVEFRVKDFTDVSLDICLERNSNRDKPVPRRVIMDMYNKYIRKAPVYEDSHYIICDIDGTLAHMEGRSPYDGSKVHTDKVDVPVKKILQTFHSAGYKVIIVTARDAKYNQVTLDWIENNNIPNHGVLFRSRDDNREDSIVKEELLQKLLTIEGCKPLFVLDDRDRVVDMWRRNGIKCLQVERGDF